MPSSSRFRQGQAAPWATEAGAVGRWVRSIIPGLPSYSPDLDPIEPAWARFEAEPRRAEARDEDGLHRAIGRALDRVSAENARAYFRRCGYGRPD
jgi:hypothetical protein